MMFLLHLNIVIVICVCVTSISSLCEVRVPGHSWPTPSVPIPVNSTVLINCTTNQSHPYWLIDVPAPGVSPKTFTEIGGQKVFLNQNGLYELQEVSIDGDHPSTRLRLLINMTQLNNQTVVKCIGQDRDILETTLFIYDPSPLMLEAVDTESFQSSNISWSSLPSLMDAEPRQAYTLSVKSPSIQEQRLQLYEPYYLFTAPEGVPPCEIYNFSITATYDVGATYTGAGCSVPSPVLSTMLPSLPDIDMLESSMDYSLKMLPGKKVILSISYQPAKYCQDYPVENYTAVVESRLHQFESKQTTSAEAVGSLIVDDLSQDGVYIFTVYAQNSVGNVSTQAREIYTTDVQRVQVSQMGGKDNHTIRTQCDFMLGSSAGGCMVVMLGEFDNTTVNVTMKSNGSSKAVAHHKLAYSLSCYDEAYAIDIEADGSLGSIALPVTLVREDTTIMPVKCSPNEEAPVHRGSTQALIIGILVAIIVLLAAISALAVVIFVLQLKLKLQSSELSFPAAVPDEKGVPLYAVPDKLKKQSKGAGGVRVSGDGAEEVCTYQEPSTTKDIEKDHENVILKTLSSHDEVPQQNSPLNLDVEAAIDEDVVSHDQGISPDPDAPPLPPPFNPDYAESAQHPIYDEVHSTRCQPKEGVSKNFLTQESHSKSQNPPMPSHVYQDISELSSKAKDRQILPQQHANLDNSTKPTHVYQDIGEICGARNPPALHSKSAHQPANINGYSNALELLPVLEMGSNSANPPPLPPRYPKQQNDTESASSSGATPPLLPRCTIPQKLERDEPTGESVNRGPGPSPSPQSVPDHPKLLLQIYDDISEVATKATPKGALNLSELSTVVEPDSINSDTPYTPEPLPTPVYEDINEAAHGTRGARATSPLHLHSPSPEHLSLHQSTEMMDDDDDDDDEDLPGISHGGTLV